MGRRENPINPESPLASFACGLRALRDQRGLTYDHMAELTNYCKTVLSQAANGIQLPTLEVTLAYVQACKGPADEWRKRWAEAYLLVRGPGNGGDRGQA